MEQNREPLKTHIRTQDPTVASWLAWIEADLSNQWTDLHGFPTQTDNRQNFKRLELYSIISRYTENRWSTKDFHPNELVPRLHQPTGPLWMPEWSGLSRLDVAAGHCLDAFDCGYLADVDLKDSGHTYCSPTSIWKEMEKGWWRIKIIKSTYIYTLQQLPWHLALHFNMVFLIFWMVPQILHLPSRQSGYWSMDTMFAFPTTLGLRLASWKKRHSVGSLGNRWILSSEGELHEVIREGVFRHMIRHMYPKSITAMSLSPQCNVPAIKGRWCWI